MYDCFFGSGCGRAPVWQGVRMSGAPNHLYTQAIYTHTHTHTHIEIHPSRTSNQHARTHKHTQPHTQLHMDTPTHPPTHTQTHISKSQSTQAGRHTHTHTHRTPPPQTSNCDKSIVQVRMRVCEQAACGCGSSGWLFAFIEGMCEFVHGCVSVRVCVCVCACVCVCRGGGRYREMCVGVGTSLHA